VCSVLLLRNFGQEGNKVAFASVTFGFQNSSNSWWPPWPRMDLDLGVQILSRNLLESTFHMHPTSSQFHLGVGRNHHFSAGTYFCQRWCDTLFWALGHVSGWVQFGCALGLGHDPTSLRSCSHTYKTLLPSLGTLGLSWLDLAFATSAGDVLLAKLPISYLQNSNLILFQLVKLHIHLASQCFFYLFLLVLWLLAR
jgi:hypothetical protein